MRNFRIVENEYVDKYKEWVELYNKDLPMLQIQEMLGINNYTYRKYRKQALREGVIIDRKSKREPRYYYKTRKGTYVVNKRDDNGKQIHYGTFKTEREAQLKVEELKKNNWKR